MKPKLITCPTCGAKKLKLVRSDFGFKFGKKTLIVPKLERYECPQCGEVLFDYDGTRRLEAARPGRRKLQKTA